MYDCILLACGNRQRLNDNDWKREVGIIPRAYLRGGGEMRVRFLLRCKFLKWMVINVVRFEGTVSRLKYIGYIKRGQQFRNNSPI